MKTTTTKFQIITAGLAQSPLAAAFHMDSVAMNDFIMDKAKGVTVGELDKVIAFMKENVRGFDPRCNSKSKKEEKAFDVATAIAAYRIVDEMKSAATETVVAETKTEGVKEMKKVVIDGKEYASREEWAAASAANVKNVVKHEDNSKVAKNVIVKKAREYYNEVAQEILITQGKYNVEVNTIHWQDFDREFRNGAKRVGFITFTVPNDYMAASMWNGTKFDWVPFNGMAYSCVKFANGRYTPASGARPFTPEDEQYENTLTIFIKEREATGEIYVTLPRSMGKKENTFFDLFRTKNIHFPLKKDHTDLFMSDSNYNLEAGLTAYVRFSIRELVKANPINRNGIDEHCGNCQYMVRLWNHDGMGEDYKNRANQKDIETLAQDGGKNESWICSVHREFKDVEAVLYMAEQDSTDGLQYEVEFMNRKTNQMERQIRTLEKGKYLIGGRAVTDFEVRKHFSKESCTTCPHFHNNAPKGEKKVSEEKARRGEDTYVSKYWTDRARAERQAVQILVPNSNGQGTSWVYDVPGEVNSAQEFRVLGLGGIMVYGDQFMKEDWVKDAPNQDYIPAMEEENVMENFTAKLCDIIYNVLRNFENVTQDDFNLVMEMTEGVELEALSSRMKGRFTSAFNKLLETIQQYQ